MKKQALSSVGLVLGGCIWFAISGYGGPGHDHGTKKTAKTEAVKAVADLVLNDEVKARLDLEVGTVEMPDVPGSNATMIAVPEGAISNPGAGGKATVYFTEDTGEAGAIQKFAATEVEIGETKNGYVEIISGLLPGDMVIVKNAARIGESGAEDAAKIQEGPTGEKSLKSPIAKQSRETAIVAGGLAESAKAPAQSSRSDVAVVAEKAEACNSRCPSETQPSQSFCPNDTRDRYQDSEHCDRDDYRRSKRVNHYSGRGECRW